MKKQEGITLIFLTVTIVILLVLAGIVITSSIDMYKKMRYENYLAQLEELQGAVDKICEKYKSEGYISYADPIEGFFIEKYSKIPGTLSVATNKDNAQKIISKYFSNNSDFHSGYVFYFYSTQIEEFFNIHGIDFDIVVDFSTRYVYSVDGCANYDDSEIVYSLIDLEESNIIQQNSGSIVSNSSGITFTQTKLQSGTTNMYKITLVLNYIDGAEGKYNINKAYYSIDGGEKWINVEYLGDCEYTDNSVSFYIYDSGTYYFKIEDTSGKVISNTQGSTDSVYTTINF